MTARSLVASVRRRLQAQILLTQVLVALSIGAAVLILLLILGTQVLDWYWPVLITVLALGYLVWRTRGRLPDDYRAAQIADMRLGTHDLLATAQHFAGQAGKPRVATLMQRADEIAAQYGPDQAAPWGLPAGWLRAVVLATVALSLLVVRYAFQESLDLDGPIAPGIYELLASGEKPTPPKQIAKAEKTPPLEGMSVNPPNQQALEQERKDGAEQQPENAATAAESGKAAQKPSQFQETMAPNEEGEEGEGAEKGDSAASGKDKKDAQGEADKDGAKGNEGAPKPGKLENQGNPQGDKNSLFDKFRDAMANMMNKMRSPNSEPNQQQAQNKQDGQKAGEGKQDQKSSEGQQWPGKQQAQGGQQQADQEGQQGQSSEKGQQQQAKGDKAGEPSGDQKSGQGKQDGSKDIQLAEQQRAMGKISEIFGKRAQDLRGEVMIEVSSSKSQSLKTDYSGKTGARRDTAGVIQRDEVPLVFQNYVQRYFEEIRKSPAPERKNP